MSITVRPISVEDGGAIAMIFFDAVHVGTEHLHDADQRLARGGGAPAPDGWRRKLAGMLRRVAEEEGETVGFMTIDEAGLIGFASVAPRVARKGVGRAHYEVIEDEARRLGASTLTTHASKAARPFF